MQRGYLKSEIQLVDRLPAFPNLNSNRIAPRSSPERNEIIPCITQANTRKMILMNAASQVRCPNNALFRRRMKSLWQHSLKRSPSLAAVRK